MDTMIFYTSEATLCICILLIIGHLYESRLFFQYHTDCQQKNRYVQMCYHTHINQGTSLRFSGPIHHPMEQIMNKFHV